MTDSIHKGHRSRMRQRFLATGFDGFQPHEILEMLLYYAIPQRDTNPLAHRLTDRFGSVTDVLRASPDALREVPGMTENAIIMMQFLRDLSRYTTAETFVGESIGSIQEACRFFENLFRYENTESVQAVYLDSTHHLRYCVRIGEGHPSATALSVRRLAEHSIKYCCNDIILSHNHPGGLPAASAEDIRLTRELVVLLRPFGIKLLDHIIVGNGGSCSLRENGVMAGI